MTLDVNGLIQATNNNLGNYGSVRIQGTGDVRYHCYNNGGIAEWLWGQRSNNLHNWTLSKAVAGNETMMFAVSTDGNVGIGNSNPTYTLDLTGNQRITSHLSFNDQTNSCMLCLWKGSTPSSTDTNYFGFGISNSMIRYQINTSGSHHVFFANTTELMRLKGTGELGIGASNPQCLLDIKQLSGSTYNGYIRIGQQNTSTNYPGIFFANDDSFSTGREYYKMAILAHGAGNAAIGNLAFCLNNVGNSSSASFSDCRMIVTSNGSVGIGTTSPGYTLEVNGNARTNITYSASSQGNSFSKLGTFINTNVNIGSGSYTYYGIDGSPLGDTSGQAGLHGWIGYYVTNINTGWMGMAAGNVSTSPQLKCNSDGTINSSVTITVSSDLRLKSNINIIENSLEKLIKLNGYTFNMKGLKDKVIGLIAQEVQEVFPELIYKDENDYLSIAYSSMAAIFTETTKELNNKIINLENENQLLKNELSKIKEHLEIK